MVPVPLEAGQGIGLAARPIQRSHVREPQVLTPGVLLDQGRQIVGHTGVLAQGQAGAGQRLVGGQAALVQPGDGAAGELVAGDLAVCGAAPQRQAAFEQVDRPHRVRGLDRLRLVDQRGEHPGVDRRRLDRQRVPGRGRDHQRPGSGLGGVERPPELRDLRGQETGGVGAVGVLAPQVVDEAVGRDGLRAVDDEVGQQGAHLRSLDGDGAAVIGPGGDGPEHAEAHPSDGSGRHRPIRRGLRPGRQETVNRPSTASGTVGHVNRDDQPTKGTTMGKIVNSTYMTLDGDISNMQDWHFEFWGDDANRAASEIMGAPEALIMGRKTYEGFYPAWSSQSGEESGADRMNSLRKYVVSNTLQDPAWNNTSVISGDVAGQIRTLKDEMDGDLLQYGFGDVSRLLVAEGLLDELKIWLHPVFSGKATSEELIYRDMPQAKLRLTDTDVHSSGVVILSYDVLD